MEYFLANKQVNKISENKKKISLNNEENKEEEKKKELENKY